MKERKNIPIQECPLYNMKSKKKLKEILFISSSDMELINQYHIFIDNNRIVENPVPRLKIIHRRIFYFLKMIKLPEYLFSSKKKSSNVTNAKYHQNGKYVSSVDISKFFPKSSYSYVFSFFYDEMKLSYTNSKMLSKLLTVDYEKINLSPSVNKWILETNTRLQYEIPSQHIPTGSPASQVLAFLSYKGMFDKINSLAKSKNIKMSVYVDDITFSSNKRISQSFIKDVIYIISTYGHEANPSKVARYLPENTKKVTGVYISKKGKLLAPSSIHLEVSNLFEQYMNGDTSIRDKLLGKANYVNQFQKPKFNQLIRVVKKK